MNKKTEERLKTIFGLLSQINKSFPKNNLVESLDEQLSYLLDDLTVQQTNDSKPVTNKLEASIKAKLQVLSEVKKDLNYQKENKCKLDNQEKTVNLTISYVDRKIKYYKEQLEKIYEKD